MTDPDSSDMTPSLERGSVFSGDSGIGKLEEEWGRVGEPTGRQLLDRKL